MTPISTNDPMFKQIIEKWLRESSDLFVDVYYPRTAGEYYVYLLRTIQDFEQLVSEARSNAVITVLRGRQFHTRGLVDDDLITKALETVAPAEPYDIVSPVFFPEALEYFGESGSTSQDQYLQDLENLRGKVVFTGKSAITPESYWEPNPNEKWLVARKLENTV